MTELKKGDVVMHPFKGEGILDDAEGKYSYVKFVSGEYTRVQTRCVTLLSEFKPKVKIEEPIDISTIPVVLKKYGRYICRVIKTKGTKTIVLTFPGISRFGEGKIKSVLTRSLSLLNKKDLAKHKKYEETKAKEFGRHEEIKKMLSDGISFVDIGNHFGFTKQRASQFGKFFGINPIKLRKEENLKKIEDIKEAIASGISLSEIKIKFNISEKLQSRIRYLGYSPITDFKKCRNVTMSSLYGGGDTAIKLTTDDYNIIKTVGGIYGVVSRKMGIYKNPQIKRGCKGLFETKKVMNAIVKYRENGLSYAKIAAKLNKRGMRTITGLEFGQEHVYFKHRKLLAKKAKVTKIKH